MLQPLTPTSNASGDVAGSASGMLGEREVVRKTGKQAIISFLESQTCFTVVRESGKVVVFDTRIPIQLAFYALVEHGERTVRYTRKSAENRKYIIDACAIIKAPKISVLCIIVENRWYMY